MCLKLLKAYPNLINAYSKYGMSCSIYITKADCVGLGTYMIKKRAGPPYFECELINFRGILNAHRATLGASMMSLKQK
jgi:hypothetical protein